MSINNPKKYSCKQCGDPFDAYQPDDKFTFAMARACFVCDVLGLGQQVERNYECDSCDAKNTIYWHTPTVHSDIEKIKAEQNKFQFLMRGSNHETRKKQHN